MSSIITNDLRILNSETFANRIVSQPTYMFIGKDTTWDDEELPDHPTESALDIAQLYKDILAVKRITADAMTSVIQRIDWTSNAIYDQYSDSINMIDDRKDNGTRFRFYVLTDEFNVYKCLSNNNGAASTTKPTSQQITEFQTPDGYIWKYMYTIRSTDVFSFMTPEWMPVYTISVNDGSSQWQVQESAIDGGIHDIVINSAGISYNSAVPPTVVIAGDGNGATANALVNPISGSITRLLITNPGSGYTNAKISLTNVGSGSGATATPVLAPVGGHGRDARLELGGVNKMIKMSLSGTEGGTFPTTTFRQAGLIYKPMRAAFGSKITVSNTNGFEEGSVVTGDTTGATGVIRSIDENGRVLWIDSVAGLFLQSEMLEGDGMSLPIERVENNTAIVSTASVASKDTLIPRAGRLMYISNREPITRNDTQVEDIRMVIGF